MAIKRARLPAVDDPTPFTTPEVGAMQALARGEASAHQQRTAYDWLLKIASGIGSQSFRAGDSHAMAFMEGRRFVGAQMVALTMIDINKLKGEPNG